MATPLHRRPGVSVQQLKAKRMGLLETLYSLEHVGSVVTRDYGDHDPRIAPLPQCCCGAPARLELLNSGKWDVRCASCNRRIHAAQKHDWSACLQWCAMSLNQMDYQKLPLFGLQDLDRSEAKIRMASIYNDLLLRSQIATLDQSLYERTREHSAPGHDYMEKIFAYRDYAKLALQLIKVCPCSTPSAII